RCGRSGGGLGVRPVQRLHTGTLLFPPESRLYLYPANPAADSSPDVIVTNGNINDAVTTGNPNVDCLRPTHQSVHSNTDPDGGVHGVAHHPPTHPVKNTVVQNVKIILECDDGSVGFICCIYDVLLVLLALIFSFMAHKLEDPFSEAKCVTFGMLVFFIECVSFVPGLPQYMR
uniref:G-protein coupled receptors family 3 profile domain-containing protein n=1 Tax=Hucho hucho TaxID=62062 RepID=A0A4W5RLG0_9TELE